MAKSVQDFWYTCKEFTKLQIRGNSPHETKFTSASAVSSGDSRVVLTSDQLPINLGVPRFIRKTHTTQESSIRLQFYYNKILQIRTSQREFQTQGSHIFRDTLFFWHWWHVAISTWVLPTQETHLNLVSWDLIKVSLLRQDWLNRGPHVWTGSPALPCSRSGWYLLVQSSNLVFLARPALILRLQMWSCPPWT